MEHKYEQMQGIKASKNNNFKTGVRSCIIWKYHKFAKEMH